MKKIFLLALFLLPMTCLAQQSELGNWLIYFGNKKINNKWNIHNEVQYRNYNAIGDLEQLLLRTGIGYNLTDNNNNLLLGYGFIHGQNYIGNTDEKTNVNEHRIFQQFITFQKINRVSVQHRYRLEERWVTANFKIRFRYFLSINVPLNNKEMIDKTWYLSTYNEIFLNAKKEIFDPNRLYGGIGYKVKSNLRLELGYMNQFLNNNQRDQINLITFFSF